MTIENTKAQMRKGILELCVLSIIQQEEAYPSDIIHKLTTSGPPRKYYSLTEEGTSFLEGLRATWKELNSAVTKATRKTKTKTTKPTNKESE